MVSTLDSENEIKRKISQQKKTEQRSRYQNVEKTISNNRDKHVQILSDKMNDFSQELFGTIQKNQIAILELKNKNN